LHVGTSDSLLVAHLVVQPVHPCYFIGGSHFSLLPVLFKLVHFRWFILFSVQQHIGTMVSFDNIDPAHELGLEHELDLGPDIDIDQDFSSSWALAHLTEFVLPTDTDTMLQFFEYHGIQQIDDFMSFDATDFKQKYSDLTNAPNIPLV
jgi:hypothetical protein